MSITVVDVGAHCWCEYCEYEIQGIFIILVRCLKLVKGLLNIYTSVFRGRYEDFVFDIILYVRV